MQTRLQSEGVMGQGLSHNSLAAAKKQRSSHGECKRMLMWIVLSCWVKLGPRSASSCLQCL